MESRSIRLATVLFALWCWPTTFAGAADPVHVNYWLSPDKQELYVAVTVPADKSGGQLYYFNNDASRLCYTFVVSGRWRLGERTGRMSSDDGKGSLGHSVESARDLEVAEDADLIAAAIKSYEHRFTRSVIAPSGQTPEATFTTTPFKTSARRSVQWTGTAQVQRQGRKLDMRMREVFVEVAKGWVLVVEASDDVAREAIESLGTARPPECYWPFIGEHFPQLKKP